MKNNRIKKLFTERGMSVTEVSLLTGISVGKLYSLMNFRTRPKGEYLSAIEYALRLPAGEIEQAISESKQMCIAEIEQKRAKIAVK